MLITPRALQPCELDAVRRARLAERARFGASIRVAGRSATVRFDDRESAGAWRARYADLLGDAPSAACAYAVRSRIETYFWSEGGPAYRWPDATLPPGAVAFLADAVTTDAFFAAIPSLLALHAAALALPSGEAAFAIGGISTAGKSTTAVACAAGGCRLLSDERCLVIDGTVLPYPRAMNLRADGLERLAADLPEGALRRRIAARRGTDWEAARFADVIGAGAPVAPAPLRVFFTIAGRAATPSSRRIRPAEALASAHCDVKGPARGAERIRALLRLLQGVACYDVVLGSPCATANHLAARVASVVG